MTAAFIDRVLLADFAEVYEREVSKLVEFVASGF